MQFVKLTQAEGRAAAGQEVWINLENVGAVLIHADHGATVILGNGEAFVVKETPEDIGLFG